MDYINSPGGGDDIGDIRSEAVPGCSLMPCAITVKGLPFVKPPWGRITAIDLNKGEIVWQIPHGETIDAVKNHPMLKGVTIPRTGRIGPIGILTTKTLVISGERGFTTLPSGAAGAEGCTRTTRRQVRSWPTCSCRRRRRATR